MDSSHGMILKDAANIDESSNFFTVDAPNSVVALAFSFFNGDVSA